MKTNLRMIVPRFIRKSYAVKFGIALLVLGLSVALIGFVGTSMITDSVEESTLEDHEVLAAQEAAAIDEWHEQNLRMTGDVSTAIGEIEDPERISNYVQNLDGDVEGVHLLEAESMELVATTADDATTLSDIEFPNESEISFTQSQVQHTEAYHSGDDHPVVAYYAGIGGEYALIVSMDLVDYGHEIASDDVTVVVDDDGQIVADSRYPGFGHEHESFLATYDDPDGLLETALDGDSADHSGADVYSGPASSAILGMPYDFAETEYIGAHHSTEMGWTVLAHSETDEAFGFVNTINQYGLYATFGGVLLIGLIGAVIGRNTARPIDSLTAKVAEMEGGNLDVEFETARIDNIGRLYEGFATMRDELKAQIDEAQTARTQAETERERVQAINDDLERTASTYRAIMGDAAEGDLTVRMDPAATDNETMRTIGEEFNAMLTEIESTVENLNAFATEVATSSEEVTASSEEVRAASEQVSESVQEISDGANQQFESLRSVDDEMSNLSTTTEEIAASSNQVADVAARTAQTGSEGQESAQQAIDAVEKLEEDREAVVVEFERLREDVAEIDQLVDRVAEIAEQTNMLALNANIEASRSAGSDDDGGFAAVAAEVKELSQDVKAATEEIDDQLEGIQEQTERSATEVERTSEEIQRVGDFVTDTVSALEEIAEYASETNEGVQEISAATEEQAASTQEVVAMVDESATIAEETTAQAEGVAAATEEQTTAMTEVSNSADDLTQQAMTLSEALDRFETEMDAEHASTGVDDAEDTTTLSFDDEESIVSSADDSDDEESEDSTTDGDEDDADGEESSDESAEPAVQADAFADGEATWEKSDDDGDTFSLGN